MTTELPLVCDISCNLIWTNPRAVQGQTSQDTSDQQVTQLQLLFRHLFFFFFFAEPEIRTVKQEREPEIPADPQAVISSLAG